jgi:SNF2 family DNA or RNA helicase
MVLVDDKLIETCQENEEERSIWLFLEPHPEFDGFWKVSCLDPGFFFDLKDLIGPYRAVSPFKLKAFREEVEQLGYKVAFFEDPAEILKHYEDLSTPPDFSLNSNFDNTVNGMLPFQIQAYNYLKDLRGGMAVHSTGTGKSRLASALVKGRLQDGSADVVFVVAKGHNLTNFQRSMKRDADIESTVVSGTKKARREIYEDHRDGEILILNYEKFRTDEELLIPLVEGKGVLIIWDEMSAKLSNRKSALYQSVISVLYTGKRPTPDTLRPSNLWQVATTATPIEVSPEGFFNCMRLLDPRVLGTVEAFHTEYVKTFNRYNEWQPETWHQLDRLGMQVEKVVHQVDKSDPDIAKWFPEIVNTEVVVDWDSKDRKIYDMLTKDALQHGFDEENPLALITVLQMLCDAPTIIQNSAARFEAYEDSVESWDGFGKAPPRSGSEIAAELVSRLEQDLNNDTHTKFQALKELLDRHSNEKVVVFSSLKTGLMPVLKERFEKWGVSYVEYDGTDQQKQEAQDTFMSDPDIRVFLSSDQGSDSLDLYEASVVINYDLPWNWSRLQQRNNRVHRIVSEHKTVYYYDLVMADSVEDRKRQLIERKKGFHDEVFRGALADRSASARMTKDDLLYALRG